MNTEPVEIEALVATAGSPLFGVVGRWRKDGDQWLVTLTHIDNTVDFAGLVVPVKSQKGTKYIRLAYQYGTFTDGAYYVPGGEVDPKLQRETFNTCQCRFSQGMIPVVHCKHGLRVVGDEAVRDE